MQTRGKDEILMRLEGGEAVEASADLTQTEGIERGNRDHRVADSVPPVRRRRRGRGRAIRRSRVAPDERDVAGSEWGQDSDDGNKPLGLPAGRQDVRRRRTPQPTAVPGPRSA